VILGWRDRAACRGKSHPDWDGELRGYLFEICMGCPVRDECLMEALDHESRSDAGVWGGTGPEERRRIRQGEDPYVVWREVAEMLEMT
jgi:WhiB family transcriptional regulator, redox-sensing transcriptional regulator